jgi:hypothetical protein
MRCFRAHLPLLVSIVALVTSPGLAQSNGTVQGNVTDPTGAAVSTAQLTVRNVGTGLERRVPTNSTGNYLFAALPVGSYRLEVRAPGFRTELIENLVVDVSTVVTRNFQLLVAQGTEVVTVTGEIPMVESSTTSVGRVIDQTTVQQIPLNGRHIEELINLVPGTVIPPANGFLTAPLRGQGSFGATTAGAREDTVNFQVNGINLQDPAQNQTTFQPSINTVSEFKLVNSTYSSEFGHTSGSVMNVVTRSGENSLHGEVFDFIRNDALDAKNFFLLPTQAIGPFKRNNFGAALGGPIFIPGAYDGRNKTFWFFSYEGLRQRQGVTSPRVGVPTQAQRSTVTDPTSQKLLPLIPQPTEIDSSGNGFFVGNATAPVDIDQYTIDVSHQIAVKDRLHGYYAHQHDTRLEPLLPVSDSSVPGFGDARNGIRQILTMGETHVFSPSVVNDFRFGANRIEISFNAKNTTDPASVGFVGLTAFGLPEIQIQSIILDFGGVTLVPQGRADTTYVFADDLSWLKGKHQFKFGTEERKAFNNNFNNDVGFFRFTNFAAFAAGKPNLFSFAQGGTNNALGQNAYQFYAQDSYKVLSNLTLELGVRFERNTAPTERFNRLTVFDPATASLKFIGSPGFSQVFPDHNNWMPRVGFSYDPFKRGKTVVRAGYGIFYDQPVFNAVSTLNSMNPPFSNPISVVNPTSFGNAASQGAAATTISIFTINPGFNDPYVQSYNLNIQQEITPSLGVMVGYFGSKSTHLRLAGNLNQPTAGVKPFKAVTLPNGSSRNLNVITETDSPGNASYNALWVTANRRVGRGLQFNAFYQWSKSLDYTSLNTQTGSSPIILQDSFNPRGNYGPSDFDARHHFEVSSVYDLPFKGKHALPARFIEGWQFLNILSVQSGNPLNLVLAGTNPGVTNVGVTVRPNRVGDPSVSNPSVANFFNPLAYAAPPSGQFGLEARNSLVGPRFFNWDLSFAKITRLAERLNLEFRSEFFNILNHPNFFQPGRICTPAVDPFSVGGQPFGAGTCVPNSSFGTITDLKTGKTISPTTFGQIIATRNPTGDFGSSRQIQFALKLKF